MKNWKLILLLVIVVIVVGGILLINYFIESGNPKIDCLGSCKCMKECNEKGPTYFIPDEEGSSECKVNVDNKICCCSGV